MIAAAIIRNVGEYGGGYTVYMGEINDIGGICLSLFLGMAMITLKLWQLAGQTLFMILYVVLVVFNIMGRDYDAAVIVSGTCGFGMGATPNAMANMQAICDKIFALGQGVSADPAGGQSVCGLFEQSGHYGVHQFYLKLIFTVRAGFRTGKGDVKCRFITI